MRELQMEFVSNPVTARWMRILTIIERKQSFTIVDLSNTLITTQRTLIKDIQSLKDYFDGAAIFLSDNHGFSFYEVDKIKYKEKKEKLLENEILFDIIGNIFYGELEPISELADSYNFSESTLRRFLEKIKKPLGTYALHLQFNPVDIIGDEGNIRKFFIDFYYAGEQTPYTLHPPRELHQTILEEISGKLKYSKFGTSATVAFFYYTLYITIERARQGKAISVPRILQELTVGENDFEILYSLRFSMESIFDYELSKEEFIWVYYLLLCNRTVTEIKQEMMFLSKYSIWPEINKISNELVKDRENNYNVSNDLIISVNSFLVSRKINDILCPVLNKLLLEEIHSIKQTRTIAYEKNYKFLKQYKRDFITSNRYLEDVAASLTIYLDILDDYSSPSKNILFLLEGDPLVIYQIKRTARKLLHQHNISFVRLLDLKEAYLNATHIDLLVTNYTPYVSEYNLFEKYLLIDFIPDEGDWKRVLSEVNHSRDEGYE